MADNSQGVVTNYSNDKRFLQLISSSFNDEEQQLFIQSFKKYLDYRLNHCDSNGLNECLMSKILILDIRHRNDKKAFVVNLDDIWQ